MFREGGARPGRRPCSGRAAPCPSKGGPPRAGAGTCGTFFVIQPTPWAQSSADRGARWYRWHAMPPRSGAAARAAFSKAPCPRLTSATPVWGTRGGAPARAPPTTDGAGRPYLVVYTASAAPVLVVAGFCILTSAGCGGHKVRARSATNLILLTASLRSCVIRSSPLPSCAVYVVPSPLPLARCVRPPLPAALDVNRWPLKASLATV